MYVISSVPEDVASHPLTAHPHMFLDNVRPSLTIYIGIRHIGCRIFTMYSFLEYFSQGAKSLTEKWEEEFSEFASNAQDTEFWDRLQKQWEDVKE